jgi:hypothetical protein
MRFDLQLVRQRRGEEKEMRRYLIMRNNFVSKANLFRRGT